MAGFHQLPYKLHVDELSCTKLTLQFLRLFALYYRLLCYYSFLLLILLRVSLQFLKICLRATLNPN